MALKDYQQYEIDFSEEQWEEIVSMGFDPFEIEQDEMLTRAQWMAIAHMALGKSVLIDGGDYGESSEEEGIDVEQWADDLRTIASTILEFFQPGDSQF